MAINKSTRMGYTSHQQGALLLVAAALLLLFQVGNCRGHDDDCHVCYLEHRQCQSACDVYHLHESHEGVDCQWDCARHFEHCCPQASTRILDENATSPITITSNVNKQQQQPQQRQQVDPVVQICLDTVSVANANQDDILTYQEYQQHLNLFKIAICPPMEEEEIEQEEEDDDDDEKEETDSQPDNKDTVKSYVKPYATEKDLQFMFADVSCLLCLGLFDPYNYDEAAEGFFDDCPGCDNNTGEKAALSSSTMATADSKGGNITLSNQTPQETKVFCHWAYDWVLPQCHHRRQQRRNFHEQPQSTTNTALWGNNIVL